MNTLLLEHFAAVSKIAAARQSRERQQGVDCSQGYLRSTDAGLMFEGPRTLEVFFNYQRSTAYQRPAGFTADTLELEILASNDTLVFYCGRGRVQASIVDGQDYHAYISYDGDTATAYLNGVVVGTITPVNYLVPPAFNIGNATYPPKGTIYFARIYNYALSTDEVAALYNNGDPAGYVLPGAYKRPGNSYVSNFTTSTERWAALDGSILTYDEANHVLELDSAANRYAHMFSPVSYDTRDSHVYDIEVVIDANPKVTKCDFYPYVATELITLPVEYLEETTVFRGVYIPGSRNSFSDKIYCYFSLSTPTIVRVRSIRVLPVGCVAEYLPQNLVANNNGLVSSWLDSAKQLPLNDEYLPPLLETAGGYDLAANGTPEVVYKPTLKKEAKIDFTEAWSYSFNWSPAQTDAAHVVENGKIRCNCGTRTNVSHPFIYSISNTCVPGRKYRFSAKYTLLSGDIHLYGYGDLEPDTLHVVQDYGVFDTKPGQYEYTTPIMSYDQVNTRFNRCIFYWGNSIPNSEFIINEIKIEEYE